MKFLIVLFCFLCFNNLVAQVITDNDFINTFSNDKDSTKVYPIYKGCKKFLTNSELKKCASENISKFIGKKFRTSIVNKTDLSPGYQYITVFFVITKSGNISIDNITAPHILLENEAIRVFNLLPPFESPGIINNDPVNVAVFQKILVKIEKKVKQERIYDTYKKSATQQQRF